MNRKRLKAAYAMIGQFKRGEIPAGRLISDEELELLGTLCRDLLPREVFSRERAEELIPQIASVDTKWNRATQDFAHEFYTLSAAGKLVEANELRRLFLPVCPSAWYCGIVKAL